MVSPAPSTALDRPRIPPYKAQRESQRLTREMRANAALFSAIRRADLDEARECLALGADPQARDAHGCTPLMRACGQLAWLDEQDARLAALLLPLSDPLAKDRSGQCALMHAAKAGAPHLLALLLPLCDPLESAVEGSIALMHAAWRGNPECVRLLLPGSIQTTQNGKGFDALMIAVINASAECISLLLPHADLTARDHTGLSAFDMARASESPKTTALMLSAEQAFSLNQTLPIAPGSRRPLAL